MKIHDPRPNPLASPPGDTLGQKHHDEMGQEVNFKAFLDRARRAENASQADDAPDPEGVKRAAEQFESFFLSQLLKTMRETVPEGGLFEQGFDNEVYTEMLDQEYARSLAEQGGIGLADVLVRQLGGPGKASGGT